MTRLTVSRYHDLCALAGDRLDHPRPMIHEVGSFCDWPTVVYLLGHRDPGTATLTVDYVGSAVRLRTDASARIREHLLDPEKRLRFTCQVVLPLRKDLSAPEVRQLEGSVARALGVPRWCRRVPRDRLLAR